MTNKQQQTKVITIYGTNIEVTPDGTPIEGNYLKWERELLQIICDKLEVDHSDATGIIGAQCEQIRARYLQGYEPGATAYYDFNCDMGNGIYIKKPMKVTSIVNGITTVKYI